MIKKDRGSNGHLGLSIAAHELGTYQLLGLTVAFLLAHLFKLGPPVPLVFWINDGHGVCTDNGSLFGAFAGQSDFDRRGRLRNVFI